MNNDQIINMLTTLLIVMVGILFVLCIIFVILKLRKDKPKTKKQPINNNTVQATEKSKVPQSYNKQSIFNFMEFDKIEDNMIIQNKDKRYLMVVQCQGINYDLMSGLEKNSVEQGFLQFLNTLRHPIQIYVQTRTVNLTNSISTYKERIKEIENELVNKQVEYNQKARSEQYSASELAKEKFEVIKQRNLYEYGIDIINNTERMSLNKNILSKHYFIIVPYYPDELGNNDFDKDEIKNIAFSELYTKAQAMISSLSVCGINSKILNSNELIELLYTAYNRDEAEVYDLNKALNARYDELYSTAQDVMEKRMKELDKKIEEDAIRKANEIIFDVVEENEREKQVKQKEAELEELIAQMAKEIITENEPIIGKEIANKAKDKIDNKTVKKKETKEKGGKVDEEKQKTTRRTTRKSVQ